MNSGGTILPQKHKYIPARISRGILIAQVVKPLNCLWVTDLVLGQPAYHLPPGHFTEGSLFNHSTLPVLAKNTSKKAGRGSQVLGYAKAVLPGGKVQNTVCFFK